MGNLNAALENVSIATLEAANLCLYFRVGGNLEVHKSRNLGGVKYLLAGEQIEDKAEKAGKAHVL